MIVRTRSGFTGATLAECLYLRDRIRAPRKPSGTLLILILLDLGSNSCLRGKRHVLAVLTEAIPSESRSAEFLRRVLTQRQQGVLAINDRNGVHLDQIVGG
jgi:hypothetical protein